MESDMLKQVPATPSVLAPVDTILIVILLHIIYLTFAFNLTSRSPRVGRQTVSTLIFVVACTTAVITYLLAELSRELLEEPSFVVCCYLILLRRVDGIELHGSEQGSSDVADEDEI